MKKIFSILIAVFMIFTFSITASAKNGNASLQQKMNAKGKSAGTAKIIAQYKTKFSDLMDQIEAKNTELYDLVDQSENLIEEDKATLLDLLENDADYSWTGISNTYKKIMANAQKSDAKALTKLFETKYEEFSAILDNLDEFENELPQYYIYDETSQMSDVEDDSYVDGEYDNSEYDNSDDEYDNGEQNNGGDEEDYSTITTDSTTQFNADSSNK
jgi:hypothetical protein